MSKDLEYNELTNNQKKYKRLKNKEEFNDFMEIVEHRYNEDIIEKHIGDEKRTFHIMRSNIPLLSPSRCLKWLVEHIFWSIPNKNLIKPRLMGQIIHSSIEFYYKLNEYIVFNKNNIIDWIKGDLIHYEEWSEEIKDKFIKDLNIAIPKIIETLRENNIVVLATEKHIANQEFHGFVDILGYKTYKGTGFKQPVLIDLKTTTQAFIKPEHILQLAIYKKILKDIPTTYILFYDTNSYECKLEQVFRQDINSYYKKVKDLIDLFR